MILNQWQLFTSLRLATIGVVFAIPIQPAWAEIGLVNSLQERMPISQFEETAQVTGVSLNPTETALEVILETAEGQTLQGETRIEDNALIIEIPEAVLALPEEDFRAQNPAPGIVSVTVTQPEADLIRVRIVGETGVPVANLIPSADGLVLSVTSELEQLEIVVTATRQEEPLAKVPRSVTVITREEIEQQTPFTRNLNDIIARTVPGFGPPINSSDTFGLTLRGREISVVIDGVPQNTNLRSIPAPLTSISPDAIERIEVVRGPNAIYGGQATGGLINIITRKPSEETISARTEFGVNSSLIHFEDSIGYDVVQSLSGTVDNFDWVTSLSWVDNGDFFDADGDRIITTLGTEEATILDGLVKLGVDLDEEQRLQLTFNYYDFSQEPDFISDPAILDEPGIQKARAIELPTGTEVIGAEDEAFLTTTNITLLYDHDDLFGSQLQSQLFYREFSFKGIAIPDDARDSRFEAIFQSLGESEQWGGRLQIETPFNSQETISLLWGLDYVSESSSQNFNIFDPEEFDASGGRVFRKIGERTFVPDYDFDDLGLFGQLQWEITDNFNLNTGLRYVNLDISADDFTTVFGDEIEGGSFGADDFVFNAGIVYNITEPVSVFASFSQGFSLPDIGRVLRFAPAGFSVGSSIDLTEPQKVDNYEIGIRGDWQNVQVSLAGFFNYSELGLDFITRPGAIFETIRAPQRNYGIEATADWQPARNWRLGSTLTWVEGENDIPDDGQGFIALNSFTIPPLKLTAYVENETLPGWRNRLQLLYSGDRDRAFEDDVDGAPIESYIIFDLLSTIQLGEGELVLAIENLFNEDYFPIFSQAIAPFFEPSNFPGQGTTLSVGYRVTW